MSDPLTEQEKELIEKWIVQNVSSNDVPNDEGSDEGLVYNLIQHLHHGEGYRQYDYLKSQNEQLLALYKKHGGDTAYLEELVKTPDKYLNREDESDE